jgi:hypothetical protein
MNAALNGFGRLLVVMAIPIGAAAAQSRPAITIRVEPETPLIERAACCQLLNFDFLLETQGPDTLTIARIDLAVHDAEGRLISRRHVSRNGMLPSIATLSSSRVIPGRAATVYNPLYSFDRAMSLAELRYRFRLQGRGGSVEASVSVRPQSYRTKTALILPLEGRVLVVDGHDYYSHHRRLDLVALRSMKLAKRQFNRYAYDFAIVDESGRTFRTDGRRNDDWLGYGAMVRAPGEGTVRDAVNDAPEHEMPDGRFDEEAGLRNPQSIPGNFVVIDHGNGECSFLAHLKRGSLRVTTGDQVRQGQVIGALGLSGDSDANAIPHIHYQLMDSCDFGDAEGLPSYWNGVTTVGRGASGAPREVQIDTGDIVISRPH